MLYVYRTTFGIWHGGLLDFNRSQFLIQFEIKDKRPYSLGFGILGFLLPIYMLPKMHLTLDH